MQVTKMRIISKATLWTNMKLAKCMETPLMTFKDVNNIALVLCQGDQELNDPYTFVDEEEFNVRLGIGGKVAFVQLLTSEGYWEGLNFEPFQEVQNANLLIARSIHVTRSQKGCQMLDIISQNQTFIFYHHLKP